ncbi:nuclear pore complex protein Nup214 isoform X3 [Pseudoliparis swirei]|uniref:nuclear pore complex protein Nup214 isoform X3 n=1 Tax=Pseudoliparis swirei TaxID=2059687 RepID=UPI0024BD7DBF|nr:nuclear pore complex protein Nup214 isoform X3 [Pseudoliparis swirei]
MSDDTDSPPEREMKDFQFRQMKKTRVFAPAEDLPRERSSLLTISNKFGLTFVGLNRTFKVYQTRDILSADAFDGKANEIVESTAALAEVTGELQLHHLALSSDELTLSVCGMHEGGGLFLTFYDVRVFVNKSRPQKLPFASLLPAVAPGIVVQDLKWNPGHASVLAVCLSDGRMMILEVTDCVKVHAELPASSGITCLCWSPKGKQVAAGKMNSSVSQYTPALEEKKVIPCPHFYTSDQPVKVLDVQWLRTFVFAVVYAAADGSSETPPELVLISLPKKDEKVETKYLNFSDTVYGCCTERQHHYFLSHVEDWDLVFAASAASIEVSVIAARQEYKIWELWILEDASRAELPVTETSEDTLPLGLAIDYTSQHEIHITEEKTLPPAPTMLMLSTEGLLCPFALLNLNPGVKQLVSAPTVLALEGERLPKPGSLAPQPPKLAATFPSAPATFPNLSFTSLAASTPLAPAAASSAAPFSMVPTAPATSTASSSGFSFSVPTTCASSAPPPFSMAAPTPFGSGSVGFSFASKPPPSDTPSAFSFTPSVKPSAVAATAPTPQSIAAASSSTVKLNLNERFSDLETPAPSPQSFSFNSSQPKAVAPSSLTAPPLSATKPPPVLAPVRPVQTSTPATVVQKPAPAAQGRVQGPQAAVGVKTMEKQLQQKKDFDPIMAGILEEIAHFQKELDDLKARSARADFKVGSNEEMKALRKESEDLHMFTLEIKETTESLHGDIGALKTTLLEGFAGAEEAKAQSELSRDKNFRQLLYKKSLDPRSEDQLKEIRRLYQYIRFAVEDVNDVLDVEWEKHLEKKKKQKHMAVPGREGLFTTLANNLYIINQQKNKLDQLVKQLTSLRLYNKTTPPMMDHSTATETSAGLESELESLRVALLKARLDTTPPKTKSKSPAVKISPVKQSQLRNFLSKGQMPPVRSTAPANLSRSAFLSPKYYEDLDDVSSTSSLSQSLEPHPADLEEELLPEPIPLTAIPPALCNPRHPTVVRTPSIHPGFGAIQSTPKIHSVQGMGFGLSPIASPVPTNRINLSGAESTALATKTVKHGAPPTERAIPVNIPAQQAAATAALRRQMANQKTALVGTSMTESISKTIPQVVNVQEFKDKGPPMPVSNVMSSSIPDPAAPVFATVSSNQAKRIADSFTCEDRPLTTWNPTQSFQKMSNESATNPQSGFVFGQSVKPDASAAPAFSADQSTSKGFSFASGPGSFSFASVPQGGGLSQAKDGNKFSFGGNGKIMFTQTGEEPFDHTPISTTPAPGTGSPTQPSSSSGEKAASTTSAPRIEPQSLKTIGGETLGSFSGLRVGHGEEVKDSDAKPASGSFSFGETALNGGKGATAFSFASGLQKSAEDSPSPDLSKGASSGSLFKPPEPSPKQAFSVPPSSSIASASPTSFGSLLAASTDPSEEPKVSPQPSELPPPPEYKPAALPVVESASPVVVSEPAAVAVPAPAPGPPMATTAPTANVAPSVTAPTEATTPAPASAAPTIEGNPDSTTTTTTATTTTTTTTTTPTIAPVPTPAVATPAVAPVSQVAPIAFQVPSFDKPGSIFTQPAPATTDSCSLGVIPVISTAAATATTPSNEVSSTAAPAGGSGFGQRVASPAPASDPAATGFGSSAFGTSAGTAFGKSVFGQVGGFGQPASNTEAASGFSFGQSAFGAGSNSANTVGGAFGAATATDASSFSFGTSGANTASSTGSGLFGQTTAPAFGQSSGFGQGSVFGSNTTTSSSTGFSFGQPSAFGSAAAPPPPAFGQQASTGSVFGQQQPSSGGTLFGLNPANPAGSAAGGGFFTGLGGKPSEDAANKNPFGTNAPTGGFGQPAQTGTNSLFGSTSAKFGFGQPSFAEQKASGTFTTGAGSVAAQGFGSFASPTKAGAFGSAPVFGNAPSFGSSQAFGAGATFGSSPSFPNNMVPSAGKVFGEGTTASSMGGFGFASPPSGPSFGALASQSAPSFGGLAQQGSGFVTQPSSFSGFAQQPQAGGFSGNTFGSPNPSSTQTFASWRS